MGGILKMSQNILGVKFEDFRKLVKDRRVYYYIGASFCEMHFLYDGFIIKTVVDMADIENEKQFFSDPIFYNAISLTFRIPSPSQDPDMIDGIRSILEEPVIDIFTLQEAELKKTDIQKEGVDDVSDD